MEKAIEHILIRGFVLLCLLLLCVSVFGVAVAADDSITVRVGVYENDPKIFTDDKGKASGLWPDIMEYIGSQEGWEIEYIHGTWAQCMEKLENNEIDIMPDVAYTEERDRLYDFSNEAVYVSWSRVYTREETDIQSIPDLEGKNIAVLKGSVNVEGPDGIKKLVSAFGINCSFIETDSYDRVFELIQNGDADAGVVSKDFGYRHESDFDLVETAIIFQPSLLYFAFPKDSSLTPYFIERIDNHVKVLKKDNNSIYCQSLEKWLGIRPAEKSVIPMWLVWVLAGTGALVLLLAGGSFILRSQVRSRTKELTEEITKRKKASAALQASEEKYRILVENAGEAIVVAQGDKLKFANSKTAELSGYSIKELTSMPFMNIIHPDDRDMVVERYLRRLRGEPLSSTNVFRVMDKNGNIKWAEIDAVSITWEGKPATLNFLADVTERKKTEQQALMSAKLASVGELVASVAHEINNPLTGIIGYAQLISDRQDVSQSVKEDLQKIHEESQRTVRIVQNLLRFARQYKPEKNLVDINELLERTLELENYKLRTSNIKLSTNLAADVPLILADYNQLQQVMLNIITNAEQAMEEAKRKGKIMVTTETVVDCVRISVIDNGAGISQENITRIFDPFFTTKPEGSGSGLGLSVCHSIIAEHGGNIYVESTLGKGTTFKVELPITTGEQVVIKQEKSVEKKSRRTRRRTTGGILIVEDEPAIRAVLRRNLSARDYQVQAVSNGKAALAKLAKNNYHLLLIDLKMPGTAGRELYETIKRKYPDMAEKMIFITGDIMMADTLDFLASTGRPYLIKPFDSEDVTAVIEKALAEDRS